ncbi:MAG: hypothetical protein NC400_05030 [Clostridium sp.]|nr:hypothetical protein [Clostridium sp.]
MNFAGLWQAIQTFDEIVPIGKEVRKGGKLYHIAGMTRKGSKARMYVLSENAPEKKGAKDDSFYKEATNFHEEAADFHRKTTDFHEKAEDSYKETDTSQSETIEDAVRGGGYGVAGGCTNRARMRQEPESDFFMGIAALKIGKTELKTEGIMGFSLGPNVDYSCEELLLFAELMKAGWRLPENSVFAGKEWKEMWVTHVDFDLSGAVAGDEETQVGGAEVSDTEAKRLPRWENQEIFVRLGKRSRIHPVEKPVELTVGKAVEKAVEEAAEEAVEEVADEAAGEAAETAGKEAEIPFTLADGRKGICYINRVYPMDVWRDNEERFKDPRYLEIVTEEELEKQKEEFFAALAEDCPKGMCYLGIEYECTLEGNLVFYDKAFLDALPKENKGSARVLMMLLKPDEPWGKHGLRQHGCVIQKPVPPDICRIEAELFSFVELLEEEEVRVEFEEVF